jgi:head-tail adaptor
MKYNRLVSFEVPTTITGEFGPAPGPWEPLVSRPGSPPVAVRWRAEVQDVLPSRSEAVRQGLAQARNQVRLRMRWRGDITSAMRVTVHGDSDVVYQIVGGPAEIGGRKVALEMMLERYTTTGGAA